MKSLIGLIPQSRFDLIEKQLGTATVVALQQLNKVVTAKTAQSIRTESARTATEAGTSVYGSEGMKFIIDGKEANTKLPMRKVGGAFELVQNIKDWAAVVGFDGPGFLLARAIAKNKREPVDVAGKTLEVYESLYGKDLRKSILTLTVSEMRKDIRKASKTNK